jgi:antitoxin (DNA-binding transcriptional repressor) of toxin-antitoxin stability system
MDTKTVGIKELQKTVPRAVKAVEGGHLTVVTRLNRPVAVMVSVKQFAGLCAEAGIRKPIDYLALGILAPDGTEASSATTVESRT